VRLWKSRWLVSTFGRNKQQKWKIPRTWIEISPSKQRCLKAFNMIDPALVPSMLTIRFLNLRSWIMKFSCNSSLLLKNGYRFFPGFFSKLSLGVFSLLFTSSHSLKESLSHKQAASGTSKLKPRSWMQTAVGPSQNSTGGAIQRIVTWARWDDATQD